MRRIEATYRKTTKQFSRIRGLLAGAESLRLWHVHVPGVPMVIAPLRIERHYIGRLVREWLDVVPVCGHGIASVMLSPHGPLKAEF